jgi:transposase
MPAAYSYDLRERVVDAVERGSSRRRAAVVFKVSAATVVRWTKRLAETGSFAAAPTGGDFKSKAVEAHKDWLLTTVNAEPDLTLAEIQARLKATHGLVKSLSCLWRFFARHQAIGKVPHGHWNIATFIAALRCDGITVPMVTDGAMNGAIFLAYPALSAAYPEAWRLGHHG